MKRNAYAKALSSPLFKKKIVLSKKTYSRKKTKITFTKNFQQQKNFLLEKSKQFLVKVIKGLNHETCGRNVTK